MCVCRLRAFLAQPDYPDDLVHWTGSAIHLCWPVAKFLHHGVFLFRSLCVPSSMSCSYQIVRTVLAGHRECHVARFVRLADRKRRRRVLGEPRHSVWAAVRNPQGSFARRRRRVSPRMLFHARNLKYRLSAPGAACQRMVRRGHYALPHRGHRQCGSDELRCAHADGLFVLCRFGSFFM